MSSLPNEQQQQQQPGTSDVHVSMEHVVRFVRQLSHDLRNHLNAAELQSAFMSEIAEDAEMKQEIGRLRSILSEMGGSLQRLSSSLAEPRLTLMPYEAESFVEDLRQKAATQFGEENGAIDWQLEVGTGQLEIDPQVLQQALLELISNAFRHQRGDGTICAAAELRNGEFQFTLREPKTARPASTENWGLEPFQHVKHGHYGVGLHRARKIIEAHGGTLEARFDSTTSSLLTRVVLPTMAS
ncbi:MAG: HAMP domain-containing histidine kinase [Chthoniobacterales bacterium]|nr:HAMP domain-containing histidine kinase [Chthoniobacterales bacterium]